MSEAASTAPAVPVNTPARKGHKLLAGFPRPFLSLRSLRCCSVDFTAILPLMRVLGRILALLAALALAPFVRAGDGRAHEAVFERFKDSVVTVEVLPLAGEAKSVLGSG